MMAELTGKFQHEKNENLDEYYRAVGIPYIPRKVMVSTSPQLEISVDQSGQWTIATISLIRNVIAKFKLGEEYEENMPGNVIIKSVTTREQDKLKTISTGPDGVKVLRIFEFNDTHCIITMKHVQSGTEAKRYFRKVVS